MNIVSRPSYQSDQDDRSDRSGRQVEWYTRDGRELGGVNHPLRTLRFDRCRCPRQRSPREPLLIGGLRVALDFLQAHVAADRRDLVPRPANNSMLR